MKSTSLFYLREIYPQLDHYCLCDIIEGTDCCGKVEIQTTLCSSNEQNSDKVCSKEETKTVKRRKRRSTQLNIEDNLKSLLKKIDNELISEDYFAQKVIGKLRNSSLRRSSKFIGVSKNGDNWQAMINNGNGKKYIGTYPTEVEAASAYDLYFLALRHESDNKGKI